MHFISLVNQEEVHEVLKHPKHPKPLPSHSKRVQATWFNGASSNEELLRSGSLRFRESPSQPARSAPKVAPKAPLARAAVPPGGLGSGHQGQVGSCFLA